MSTVYYYMKNHECKICDYKTVASQNIIVHIKRVHLKIKDFKCEIFRTNFFSKTDVLAHLRSVHKDITNLV